LLESNHQQTHKYKSITTIPKDNNNQKHQNKCELFIQTTKSTVFNTDTSSPISSYNKLMTGLLESIKHTNTNQPQPHQIKTSINHSYTYRIYIPTPKHNNMSTRQPIPLVHFRIIARRFISAEILIWRRRTVWVIIDESGPDDLFDFAGVEVYAGSELHGDDGMKAVQVVLTLPFEIGYLY
jgi:hypothetical protein